MILTPDLIAANASLDQNDTDNGKRLLRPVRRSIPQCARDWSACVGGAVLAAGGRRPRGGALRAETARLMKLEAQWIFPLPMRRR